MPTTVSKETGGGAFPHGNPFDIQTGMTLRDYFAAKALIGVLALIAEGAHTVPSDDPQKGAAEEAYKLADAMLRARKS